MSDIGGGRFTGHKLRAVLSRANAMEKRELARDARTMLRERRFALTVLIVGALDLAAMAATGEVLGLLGAVATAPAAVASIRARAWRERRIYSALTVLEARAS